MPKVIGQDQDRAYRRDGFLRLSRIGKNGKYKSAFLDDGSQWDVSAVYAGSVDCNFLDLNELGELLWEDKDVKTPEQLREIEQVKLKLENIREKQKTLSSVRVHLEEDLLKLEGY
jgi:hypothetical protein